MAEQRTQNCEALKKSLFNNNKSNDEYQEVKKPTSLSSLIVWNVSKAMEKNPNMDIKGAIKAAHDRLADSRDVHAAISNSSEQRHFTCALLAWQQLGHSDTDSLYHFIEDKIKEQEEDQSKEETYSLRSNESPGPPVDVSVCNSQLLNYSIGVLSASFGTDSVGPVIKLPAEEKIVMRADARMCNKCQGKQAPTVSTGTKTKLAAACPKTKSCDSRLTCLDKEIGLLRNRAAMLAKREKERVELLHRAEEAWKELERGYQRRLMLAEEKEEDLTKQAKKAVEERNVCKNSCNSLTKERNNMKDKNEARSTALSDLDKQLCELSCQKLKLNEEAAKVDSELAEYHCKTSQLDRDMQFKEDQARRKMQILQNELESSQTMTNETERAMRAELCALKVQLEQVSKQLLEEDTQNYAIKKELEDLRGVKMGMVEDLEGCQQQCDSRMQGKMDELKNRQEQYAKLKERFTQCRCKLPVDVVVEAKRTASLAALCHCSPEDRVLKSCSCTSMRSRLISSLLSDLFSGLQLEMGGAGQQMPCQMLKCLEDKHNWDKASVVKTNLENYFDKLLIGELDIAIATSIEKYHAKWVGTSCADRVKPHKNDQDEDWQQRAIERRAQNLAQGLAEQLFEQRAEELEQRAKDIVTSGPPPCECTPSHDSRDSKPGGKGRDEAAYPVLTSLRLSKLMPHKVSTPPPTRRGAAEPIISRIPWRSAMQDVTKLKEQIEFLNKESIKKADLKRMEENITRIMQQSSSVVSEVPVDTNDSPVQKDMIAKKEVKNKKVTHPVEPDYYISLQKSNLQNKSYLKQKTPKPILKQSNENGNSFRAYKKLGQNYAINMCMCSQRRAKKKLLNSETDAEARDDKKSKIIVPSSSVKRTKPINSNLQSQSKSNRKCNGVCFHKTPSNTSIDQLLETLVKWNKEHSSSENEKELCSLLPGGCPRQTAKIKQQKDEAYTNLQSINDIGERSSPSKHLTEQIEGSRSRSDDYKSLGTKKIPWNDINIENSTKLMNSAQKTSSEKESKSEQPSLKDEAGVLPPTGTSQLNNEKQESFQSRSFNKDSVMMKKITDGTDKNKNVKPLDISEFPLRDTDVIPPTESKYMGEINLDKSVEEVCKCSKCNDLTCSKEVLLPCSCRHKIHTTKTMKDKFDDQDKPVDQDKQKHYDRFSEDKKVNGDNVQDKPAGPEQKSYDRFSEVKKINGDNVQDKSAGPEQKRYDRFPEDKKINGDNVQDKQVGPEQERYDRFSEDKKISGDNVQQKRYDKFSQDKRINGDNVQDKSAGPEQKSYDRFSDEKKINGDNMPIGDTKIEADNESIKMQKDSKTKNPSDSYDIKFLGVTLTDVGSQNQENTNKQYIVGEKNQGLGPGNNDKNITINREMKSKEPIIMTLETKEEAGDQGDTHLCKESPSCKCKLNANYKPTVETKRGKSNIYDKTCIERVFQSQQTSEDKVLSIQHFEVDQKEDTPCVCCSYKDMDGSEDLEENTFHLLEEHIKDKLQEFKQTSCNDTCIPSEEEEKLFTAILSRVKKVIAEGTNKITCKCSKEEGTSQGSWNRAYGLLQEYLKTKIKRLQCSCVLAEENNDTILPDVIDKVFHLIEYDFKRLQDICGCKTALEPPNSRVCFKAVLPEGDEDFQNGLNTNKINSDVPKNAPTLKKERENNSPDYEMFLNNVQDSEAQQNLILDKDSILDNDDKLLGIQETKLSTKKANYQKSNQPYECICTNFECSVNGLPNNSKETMKVVGAKPVHDTTVNGKRTPILNTNDDKLLGVTKPVHDTTASGKRTSILNTNDDKLLGVTKPVHDTPVSGKRTPILNTNDDKLLDVTKPVHDTTVSGKKTSILNTNDDKLLDVTKPVYDTTVTGKRTSILKTNDDKLLGVTKPVYDTTVSGKRTPILNTNDDKLLGIQEIKPSANKTNYQKFNQPCDCTNFECSVNGLPNNSNETVNVVFTKPVHDTTVSRRGTPNLNTTNVQESSSDQVKVSLQNLNKDTEPLVKIASKGDKITENNLLNDRNAQLNSIDKKVTKCTCCTCTSKTTRPTLGGGSWPNTGYTIDCSCDAALGPCYCPKSGLQDKRNDINNIIKKSSPEEKVYHEYDHNDKKVFSMDKIVFQTQSLSEMVNGDLFLHKILNNKFLNMKDRETEASSCEADGLILKDSREYLTKAHNINNTCDDIASLATDSSPHGWCGSHMCHGVSQSDRLSHSYYNPDDFENSYAKNENTLSSEFQEKCGCDMVPICHVKMLVENIENKLVTANCTCDFMIPQVCPIHSMR